MFKSSKNRIKSKFKASKVNGIHFNFRNANHTDAYIYFSKILKNFPCSHNQLECRKSQLDFILCKNKKFKLIITLTDFKKTEPDMRNGLKLMFFLLSSEANPLYARNEKMIENNFKKIIMIK